MKNQEAYERVQGKVKAKMGFYIHLAVAVGASILLLVINVATSAQYLWSKWPLMGLAISVFWHAMAIFLFSKKSSIPKNLIEREMEKENLARIKEK